MGENLADKQSQDTDVILPAAMPMRKEAGFLVLSGDLFDSALMKTSVISPDFRERFLSEPGRQGVMDAKAVVFEGPEDYHDRINDESLGIDDQTILFIRYVGPVGYPGSAEVVNMQPPDSVIKRGVAHLPTVGDGRQSGTSESPSILNASPEAAVGGGLAIIETGDTVRLDIPSRTLTLEIDDAERAERWEAWSAPDRPHQTPWQDKNSTAPMSDSWRRVAVWNLRRSISAWVRCWRGITTDLINPSED